MRKSTKCVKFAISILQLFLGIQHLINSLGLNNQFLLFYGLGGGAVDASSRPVSVGQAALGQVKRNRVPFPGADSSARVPPADSTIFWTMARPTPVLSKSSRARKV